MRTIPAFDLKTPARLGGYLLLGGLGSIALAMPLAGVLNYAAGLLTPLLFAWLIYGPVAAVTRPTRMARVYVFGNLGVVAATLVVLVAMWIILVTVGQPSTAVTAPAYLGVVLVGLVAGIVVGARRRTASAPQR